MGIFPSSLKFWKKRKKKKQELKAKVVIFGDKKVGKTAIFRNIKGITVLYDLKHSFEFDSQQISVKWKGKKM